MGKTQKYAGQMLLFLSILVVPVTTASADTPIKVMTYNTHHGGTRTSPPSTDDQLDTIAAENPDVVALQEVTSSQMAYYVNGLNARMRTTAWHGSFAESCTAGTEPTCTSYSSEGVAVLTTLETVAVTPRLVWAKDDYSVARAALRMSVALADGSQANVFSVHLPALVAYRAARVTYVNTFTAWAQTFDGPKLVAGDFNDVPGTTPIIAMTQQFSDAWTLGGSGSGFTHRRSGATSPYRRIDYSFSDTASKTALSAVRVVGNPLDSDHLPVVATYAIPSAPSAVSETTLMHDGFDSLDPTQWPEAVITGKRDATVPVAVANGMLRIGDLNEGKTRVSYNGISSGAYNLSSNGCASVHLVTAPNLSSTAYAMFAVVRDTSNYYRWYESGGTLVAEQKIGGAKATLADLQYDPALHQFLRIRKEANTATGTQDVVFETAPNNGDVPGTFTERYREVWSTAVTATSLKFELKTGTSRAETAPGSTYFDTFNAAANCR
jgi:endonuclease/exonuclease/phosphatase family metal-dependent hydrolase